MPSSDSITAEFWDSLGPDLYTACRQNDVAQVKILTSAGVGSSNWFEEASKWSAAILTAAAEHGTEVAEFCLKNAQDRLSTLDAVGTCVLSNEGLEPAYRFLVDSSLMNPEHRIEWMGQLLGLATNTSQWGVPRYSLVEYLLAKDVDPNQTVEMFGGMFALTYAAGWSDQRMLGILLDGGAALNGIGALRYAAGKGRMETVKFLLDRGANVNEMVSLTQSRPSIKAACAALHAAVENGHVEIVDVLLGAGADVQLKDAQGRTAAEIARAKGMGEMMLAKLS